MRSVHAFYRLHATRLKLLCEGRAKLASVTAAAAEASRAAATAAARAARAAPANGRLGAIAADVEARTYGVTLATSSLGATLEARHAGGPIAVQKVRLLGDNVQ